MSKTRKFDDRIVPFNDLRRIHDPLKIEFQRALSETLEHSDFILGDAVPEFENSLANIEAANHAIAVSSGTSALLLILKSLNIGPGDIVLAPAMTFIATVFAIESVGASAELVDIDLDTGLMDINQLSSRITKNVKAAIFVTLHGRVDKLLEFKDTCERHEIHPIIDAAQSHLGKFNNIAQVSFGAALALSFYPGKNLGALGEGGAVLTQDAELAERIRWYRNWGSKERYIHKTWGGNFRLDSLQCRFLDIKLLHLAEWTRLRKQIAQEYSNGLPKHCLLPEVSSNGSHVYHIYAIKDPDEQFRKRFESSGIQVSSHYPLAIHQNPYYQRLNLHGWKLKEAENFASMTLSIPLFPYMERWEIEKVIEVASVFQE